ncbi:hypothetical protein ACF05L_34345 [Streptomyces bobili]|uniref:hypothetical protein n=1 Tax=Streptomyces bobili TaxID=67280 RepID=UPI0036FF0DBF
MAPALRPSPRTRRHSAPPPASSVVAGGVEGDVAVRLDVCPGAQADRKATGTPLAPGTGHILAAMRHHGVRRHAGHATPAVLDPQEKPAPVTPG